MLKPYLALYVGGMGARGRNFYTDLVARYGYEAEARQIQDLYLEGRKGEAAGAVPDALVDETALVGPPGRIREALAAWSESGVGTLIAVMSRYQRCPSNQPPARKRRRKDRESAYC